jgi:translocation and assembly module TamB
MKRRHIVILVSAITLVTIIFVAAVTIGVGVGTEAGRNVIRQRIESDLAGSIKGKVHLGSIRGNFLKGVTIDTFEIRDLDDSVFFASGPISFEYDSRDLMDRRILLRNMKVERPLVRLRQYQEGDWNLERLFKSEKPKLPGVPGRSFGDYVRLDSVRVRDGRVILVRPWSPSDSLRGAKRDSVIRHNLAAKDREIRRSGDGFTRTYRWTKMAALLPRVRIADPDSNKFGQLFVIEQMRADESDPPFKFSNVRGTVRKLGDTILIDAPHFDLPASTGSARGRVWWGHGTRVDVRVRGDSVSLRDVAWVYPTFPREGRGSTDLRITNDSADISKFQFALSNIDAYSTKSHITGAMTFGTGEPVLAVRDVDLRGSPVNFDLLRTFAGDTFPVDWQGDLFGMVRGPGGPLNRFVIDTSFVTFRDAHVRGAISQASGRGGVNILYPALAKFHAFTVNAVNVDLRSLEFLFPEFPRIHGTVSGVATLDSSWLDVRFSNADITHRNGPGEPTRVTGSGRITYGEQFVTFDAAMNAQPLSLTQMSRAYDWGLKGVMNGPILAKGTADDFLLTMRLQGPGGRFSYNGRMDMYGLSIAARGTGRAEQLDPAVIVDRANVPTGFVTGDYQFAVRGDTNDLGTLVGNAAMQVERAELDGIRVFPSRVHARFADRRMYLDTMRVESVAATVTAMGAIGLAERTPDTLSYTVSVDSLGGLRRYVTQLTSGFRGAVTSATDSIAGTLLVQGVASGSVKALDVKGTVTGNNLFVRREAGREVTGSFDIADLVHSPAGNVHARFTSLNVGGILIDTLGTNVLLTGGVKPKGSFAIGGLTRTKVVFQSAGDFAMATNAVDVLLRSVIVRTDSGTWALDHPSRVVLEGANGIAIDSLIVANGRGARIAVNGVVPDTGRARMALRADNVPLRDVGQIMQLKDSLRGVAHMSIEGAGTAASPEMNMQARLSDVRYGALKIERVNASAVYAMRRAQVGVDLQADGRPALIARGSLPLELSYFGAALLEEDSLRATVRTDSASLNLITAVPGLRDAKGRLIANLDIGGTWKHPDVTGPFQIENGEVTIDSLGITLRGINVDVAFFGHLDSLAIRRAVAVSGLSPDDSVSLTGYVEYADVEDPYLNLRLNARTFRAIDRRSVARLDISTEPAGLRLTGNLHGASLKGGVIVDRGSVFLPDPELARKRPVDFTSIIRDTLTVSSRPSAIARLFESILFDGVRVTLGDEVWLQSPEARIKLAGSLNVQRRTTRSSAIGAGGIIESDSSLVPVFDGVVIAERGTYTLDLGRVVQREFQVEGGTVMFFPTDLDPLLNIAALHTVRASTGANVRIRVRITGPLSNPAIALESAESFAMSQSDMVSYLIFGQPNFELGSQGKGYVQLAAQTLFPTATSFAAQQLRGIIGSAADWVQLRPGAADVSRFGQTGVATTAALGNSIEGAFLTSRLGGEKQITENLFVSLSTGLCGFTRDDGSVDALNILNGLSGRFEYRFSRDASVKLGKEPSACSATQVARVVAPPSQWGLSFFKTWRF